MTEKPSRNEEEYFARREAELVEQRREAATQAAAEQERKSHHMKCPKCGYDLVHEDYHGVEVDHCRKCHGIWFDAGEARSLLKRENTAVAGLFKSILRGVGRS
jgi:ribosomal protein L37AE/L43A